MTEQKAPELWWSPTRGAYFVPGGNGEYDRLIEYRPAVADLPPDAVRLVPAPSEQTPEGVTLKLSMDNLRQLVDETRAWFGEKVEVTGVPEPVRAAAEAGEELLQRWLSVQLVMPGGPDAPLEQTYEWGWRRTWDKPDDVSISGSEEDARDEAYNSVNAVAVRRLVGSWETVEEASDHG